jgi:hypothetical protein
VDEQEVRVDEHEVRGKVGDGEEGVVRTPHVMYATLWLIRYQSTYKQIASTPTSEAHKSQVFSPGISIAVRFNSFDSLILRHCIRSLPLSLSPYKFTIASTIFLFTLDISHKRAGLEARV